MTVPELQTLRDALVTAMSKGLLEVTSGDKTIRYQSVNQMQLALGSLDKEIAVAGGTANVRTILVQHSRG
jgi:hypothetical protein